MTPTQRTLAELRKRQMPADVVERWIKNPKHPAGGFRKDFMGIIDIIALDHENGFLGIQSTGTGFSEHFKKLTQEKPAECVEWLLTPGAMLELWGWRKVKVKRGGKAQVYQPRIHRFTLDEMADWLTKA